jgi:hypothetical protein
MPKLRLTLCAGSCLMNLFSGGLLMRMLGLLVLAACFLDAAASKPAEARSYPHRYGYCLHALHYDYSHSNNLSPYTYIYPAANWGPFFQCRMYYSPVDAYHPLPY